MMNLKESCLLAYKSDKNTSEVLATYREKNLSEAKDIMPAFVADCIKINAWRTKRQLSIGNSENAAGWKAVKAAGLAILDREPGNKAAQVLCGAAVLYNRLSTMIASQKADVARKEQKEQKEEKKNVGLTECPVTTVWDIDGDYIRVVFPVIERSVSVQAQKILAGLTGKESAKVLRGYIEQLAA